ncbi:NAD(P)H-quinone oxidoreductase [Idiomarina sp.]|uniref:NAD(P)H-quinone oxidoreductase n=1 Tax=Idiomarina sp. TaxID=1874361 RepID=UPI0025B8DDC8|nr:NAD(P)H-quinone oxidoreductase [Idiomarina sp.]NQZ03882.1 NAD(P)H-quinone oxidoreductase [Idiomarina sp.]
MKAARIKDGRIEWTEVEQSKALDSHQVRIAISHAGMNRADLMQVAGAYPPPPGASDIPGLECSGTILEVGADVDAFNVGDKVCALLAAGGYAEQVVVDQQQVLPLPKGWSPEQGAGWLETFATAFLNVFQLARVKSHERVLIHAAAGGVGTSLIQLCKEKGIASVAVVGTDEKQQFCRKLGSHMTINRHHERDWQQLDSEGVDVILNPIGGDSIARDQGFLNTEGRIILIGLMGGREGQVDFGRMLIKRQRIIGSTLRALSAERKGSILRELWDEFGAAFSAKRITPILDRVVAAHDVNEAMDYVRENRTFGKVILDMQEN